VLDVEGAERGSKKERGTGREAKRSGSSNSRERVCSEEESKTKVKLRTKATQEATEQQRGGKGEHNTQKTQKK
jgi:hypothetical protein